MHVMQAIMEDDDDDDDDLADDDDEIRAAAAFMYRNRRPLVSAFTTLISLLHASVLSIRYTLLDGRRERDSNPRVPKDIS
jgi:hypothetical protein